MDQLIDTIGAINDILWHDVVLYIVLGTGILFTIWSGFSQYRALTHGTQVIRGRYDDPDDPGAINHFQALSTALSATVGLGNIAGVALAISLGGPGAVFWMWMVGIFGMALKTTEVTLSMLYRNTDVPDEPHGGPMWVAQHGFSDMGLRAVGTVIGGVFCITLLISATTGGNMFQAWNVAEITNNYFPSVPKFVCGVILAMVVGMVIIGGIRRIGAVAGRLVPLMCVLYLLAALYVLGAHIAEVPAMLKLIVVSAFSPADAAGAFLGGTAGYAFLLGMKRALFSSEAGQGSAPIAHSAAKTDEPVREGIVAGLEPFVDTIVVCTLTTLVILLSGAWNRGPEAFYPPDAPLQIRFASSYAGELPEIPDIAPAAQAGHWTLTPIRAPARDDGADWQRGTRVFAYLQVGDGVSPNDDNRYPIAGTIDAANDGHHIRWQSVALDAPPVGAQSALYLGTAPVWTVQAPPLPPKTAEARRIQGLADSPGWRANETVFMILEADLDAATGRGLRRLTGQVTGSRDNGFTVTWGTVTSITHPSLGESPDGSADRGVYGHYIGAALTGHAFDRVLPGLGMWLVTIACWLFAISTIITWSYYGEQGVIYLLGERAVLLYKTVYCALIMIATLDFIRTDEQLDEWTTLGTGVMLIANIPIMLIFGYQAMRAYKDYCRRLDSGELEPPHFAPRVTDVVSGRDVQ
jgi:alanine or glycine:cation symporter, AGCS family